MPDNTTFLTQFLRAPGTIGAIAPSSAELARRVTADVPRLREATVLELGPGTGAFSGQIQRRLGGRGRHLAVEVNSVMATTLRARHPAVEVIEADARDVAAILRRRGVEAVDLVVSGLPWAVFPATTQEVILDSVVEVLRPTGRFVTFAYTHATVLPAAVAFRRRLAARFDTVTVSPTVWQNLPPARIITASDLHGNQTATTT